MRKRKGIKRDHRGLVVKGKEEPNMTAARGSLVYEKTLAVLLDEYGKEGLKSY